MITTLNLSHMSPTNTRRRQRSARLVVAVAFLVVSVLAVAGALLSGSFLLVALAAVAAVLLGSAAVRITHSELMQARRDAARDRAEQAQAYQELDARRTDEHHAHADTLVARIAERQQVIHELEGELSGAQRRLAEEHRKVNREARRATLAEDQVTLVTARADDADQRAAEAIVAVAALEQQVTDLKTELVAWETAASAPLRRHG
ncbi:putative multidomain membrane protein [metagenome]|uniref:Putative multidomain membrane protein n=1 Tax=metagenome TaxID=256318 RepID=A0A2P2BXI7_9ZZZZ